MQADGEYIQSIPFEADDDLCNAQETLFDKYTENY